jgi:hypothetical protein
MGEVSSRCKSELGHDDNRWTGRRGAARSYRSRANRSRAGLVWTVALLLPATMAAKAAASQDEPPKGEAPKAAPRPPLVESPQRPEPPPPDVQKPDGAPAPKQKEAPTAPAEKQKTAPEAPADAPQTPAPGAAGDDREAMLDAALALSTRYKFVERYGIDEDRAQPQLITQYRVGVIETTKYQTDRAQGAPERAQRSRTTIYAERAAAVGKLGEPVDLMRRYDQVHTQDLVKARAMSPPFLQGLTVWYHRRPPMRPQILSLTPDRSLREDEFALIAHEVGIPQLTAFFPVVPKRVGQNWSILRTAVQAVSGKLPDEEGYEMTGTLAKVSRSKDGKSLVAEIGIVGEFDLDAGPSAFSARIDFEFVPRGVAFPAAGAEGAPKVVEAAGRITQALLSHATEISLPNGDGRLKQRVNYEVILERRPLARMPGEPGDPVAPVLLPEAAPTPTPANSWVTYDDQAGRFHFRHPQELELSQEMMPNPNAVKLQDLRPAGSSFLALMWPTARGDTERDLSFRDAAHFKKAIEKQFEEAKDAVTWGSVGYLDDEDWKTQKRKVYRMEAAFTRENGDRPVYANFYLVSESNGLKTFAAESWMGRDGHVAFRQQVEDVIKSFQWSPSEKRSPASSPAPAPTNESSPPGAGARPTSPGTPSVAPAPAPGSPPG